MSFLGKLFKKYTQRFLLKDPAQHKLTLARIYAFCAWNLLGVMIFYFCDEKRRNAKVYYEVLENGDLVELTPGQQYIMNHDIKKKVHLYKFEGMKLKSIPDPRDLVTTSDPKTKTIVTKKQ